jgi:predicted phage terminase large subunit-like protein
VLDGIPSLSLIRAERAKRSLKQFIIEAWPHVEPSTPFVDNWHIDLVCEHLEAVTRGRIKYLLINVPPRQMKSTIVSVIWPAWEWVTFPGLKYLTASFQQTLSVRDAGKSRMLMQSRWYRDNWGDVFRFRGDQDSKGRYENDKGGHRIALSTESGGTGEGGDRLLYDDPHSLKDSTSVAAQKAAVDFWTTVMGSRGNSSDTARVVIMQRSSPDDLSAHCLKDPRYRENYICLPLNWDGIQRSTSIHKNYDPRTEVGQLLWPARFNAAAVENLKLDLKAYGVNAQLQQAPTYRGSETNSILGKFGRYVEGSPPTRGARVQSWDTANKPGSLNAFNACITSEMDESGISITDVLHDQYTYPSLRRAVVSHAKLHRPDVVLIEEKASGIQLLQELPHDPEFSKLHISLVAMTPLASKEMRWNIESLHVEQGNVWLPESAAWLIDLEAEIAAYPNGLYKDRTDALSQKIHYWRTTYSAERDAPSYASGGTRTFANARVMRR